MADEAMAVWNEVCGGHLGRVVKLHDSRRRALMLRFREDFAGDLLAWRSFCERVMASGFLTGSNDRGWRADFDWCLKPANFAKIAEGRYDQKSRAQNVLRLLDLDETTKFLEGMER